VVEKDFSKELNDYIMEFKVVDVDATGNDHVVKDFGLYTKSIVITEQAGDRAVRFKVLSGIWEYIRNEEKLKRYIRDEVKTFIGGGAAK